MANSNSNTSLSYTSRDYQSIYNDLTAAMSNLTNLWTSEDECDPGIVLIKLISSLGDMLSYNQDKQCLEMFRDTVKQRKNATQVFGLIGYNMHWFRSARCEAMFTTSYTGGAVIPRYSRIYTVNNQICYTNPNEIYIIGGNRSGENISTSVLIQGTPVTPSKVNSLSNSKYWHSEYGYNMYARDVINNRYYLNDVNVDDSSIILVDDSDSEDTWEQVESVDLETSVGKSFEFGVDEYEKPYIKLVNYWQNYQVSNFKLFYILSDGPDGEIRENALNSVSSGVYSEYDGSDISKYIEITNYKSSYGYDPETPDEARKESKNYINTMDTLITLQDFTNATRRIEGVSNALATDADNDITCRQYESYGFALGDNHNYLIKLYIVRDNNEIDDDEFTSRVLSELRPYKMMPLTVMCQYDESITYYYWTIQGELYLTEPVDVDTAYDLLTAINERLIYTYSPSNIEFNQEIKFIDIIHTIEDVSPLIDYIDTDKIKYYTNPDDPNRIACDGSCISGKRTMTVKYDESEDESDSYAENTYYVIKLDLRANPNDPDSEIVPIKPKSVSIKLHDGYDLVIDDGYGKIIDFRTALQNSGTINYDTGEIRFELTESNVSDIVIDYKLNQVNMAMYYNLDTTSFFINNGSLKES